MPPGLRCPSPETTRIWLDGPDARFLATGQPCPRYRHQAIPLMMPFAVPAPAKSLRRRAVPARKVCFIAGY